MKYQVEFKHKNKDFEDVWNIEHEYLELSTIATVKQTIEWDSKTCVQKDKQKMDKNLLKIS